MALDDLIEPLNTTSSVLGEAGLCEWTGELDERKSAIKSVGAAGDMKTIENLVSEVRGFFGGIGSLNDLEVVLRGRSVRGKEGAAAGLYVQDQLDDLFFHLLTWRTEKQEASAGHERMMKSFIEVMNSVDQDFARKHPDWAREHPGEVSSAKQVRPRVFYRFNPQWFRKWSD